MLVATRATPASAGVVAGLAGEMEVGLVGRVPADDAVRRADVAGVAIVDAAPGCAAVAAVEQLVQTLLAARQGAWA